MKIIGTGLSGLVGSRVVELLADEYTFTNLSLETGIDITNPDTVSKYIDDSDCSWVFHFAAMTDVDGIQKEKSLGEKSKSWIVNVKATKFVAEAAAKSGKKLLYISTDFVFDGTQPQYTEEDIPNPQGWYATTKYEGEKIVADVPGSLIIRIANPYCASVVRHDFVHKIIDRLSDGIPVSAPDDQQFVPTLIDDIARAIDVLVQNNASGIYHVVGSECLSPYDVVQKIVQFFHFDQKLVAHTHFDEYFKGRAPRPRLANLKNDKLVSLGVHMSTFTKGLATIKLLQEKKL